MHALLVSRNGSTELHIADTEQQMLNAIFVGNPPPGMTLDQIKHMRGAQLLIVGRVVDHRAAKEKSPHAVLVDSGAVPRPERAWFHAKREQAEHWTFGGPDMHDAIHAGRQIHGVDFWITQGHLTAAAERADGQEETYTIESEMALHIQ